MAAISYKAQKIRSSLLTNLILIVICLLWLVPIIGILITSFRPSTDVFQSGWWSVFPHKENVQSGEIILPATVDVNGPITIDGVTHTFEEWRQGVNMPDGRYLEWFGNRRTRKLTVSAEQWVGFATGFTLKNYEDVLTGKTIN